jgi:hypothetical protein
VGALVLVVVVGAVGLLYSGGVHSVPPLSVGRVPGCATTCGAIPFPRQPPLPGLGGDRPGRVSECRFNRPRANLCNLGLNLYGQGEFARNPSFPDDPTRRRPPVEIAPGTAAGSKVQEYSEALWLHYQSLAAEPSYKDLADLLRTVCEDIEEGGASALPFVRGVATSFRARSASSPDLLAESDVVALWWAPREFACVSRELDPCLRPPRPRPPRLGALL